MPHFYLFAGESSGDLHGGKLVQALHAIDHTAIFSGVGGPCMRQEGVKGRLKMENFQVMGFTDVLKSLPKLIKYFHQVRNEILTLQPEAVILIDYPGFNLRLAKALRKKNYRGKIVQYISPSVWAHGKRRIQTMVQTLDLLLTIYPFESTHFSSTNLPVKYIGNPLVENIDQYPYNSHWKNFVGMSSDQENIVAFFPGSREGEIKRHMPIFLEIATKLLQIFPEMSFAFSYTHPKFLSLIQSEVQKSDPKLAQYIFFIPPEYRYELMRACRLALAKSGTVTLELALHKKPSVVIYQLTPFNYFVAKHLLKLKLPYYCIVNILKGREIFPEFFGKSLPKKSILEKLIKIHQDPIQYNLITRSCTEINHEFGKNSSHQIAAKAIWELLS